MGATSYLEVKINPMHRTTLRKAFDAAGVRPMPERGVVAHQRDGLDDLPISEFPLEVIKAGVVPALDFIDQLDGDFFTFYIVNETGVDLQVLYNPSEETLNIDLIDANAVVRKSDNRYLDLARVHDVLGEFIKYVKADVLTIHFDNG